MTPEYVPRNNFTGVLIVALVLAGLLWPWRLDNDGPTAALTAVQNVRCRALALGVVDSAFIEECGIALKKVRKRGQSR
jgi:hypothetical protein